MNGECLYSFAELHHHYRACRRNKRNTWNALAFEIDAETNLLTLQAELRAHTYRPGRSICFVTDGPKPREVFAADFRDRIVHHLLVWHQERVFEPAFIADSYACRRGKGTRAASDRLMVLLRHLNELDQYVKRKLKCRAYVRYVDDLILLSSTPQELLDWREQIASFLEARLALQLRSQPATPFRVSRGVDFVGWRTWPTHRVVRHQTLRTLRTALQEFEGRGIERAFSGVGQRIVIQPSLPRPLRRPMPSIGAASTSRLGETLASYSGHLRHGAARRDWGAIREQFRWLPFLFAIDSWRVRARWWAN